jgi:ADP-ribosylglycohydrolase
MPPFDPRRLLSMGDQVKPAWPRMTCRTVSVPISLVIMRLSTAAWAADGPKVLINQKEFRDRVLACWLGKNIGGTLGMPFEGKREPQNVTFYTNLTPGEPAANDDLDLQILWLRAMQDHAGQVDARLLGEYWLKYVPVDWNEYGVGKRNMRLGLLPPLSGEYDNRQWKHSNGAWIRSEIWACLAPGCPVLAAQLAREDACVDHGAGEGTLAELFTAAIESAAFVEPERDKLLDIGLAMIPHDSQVAIAIRAAIAARQAGKDWAAARLDVIQASEATGWFQAPRNLGYLVLGWLYGDGDFGRSLCLAVNCGDDTDCTGATLGSLFGILQGTKGIPERWSQPVGLKIKTVAISGFQHAEDINELTDQTVAMTKTVLAQHNAPVALTDGPTDLRRVGELALRDPAAAKALWDLSPYQVVWNEPGLGVVVDYFCVPVIAPAKAHPLRVSVSNRSGDAQRLTVALCSLPLGWSVTGLPQRTVEVAPDASADCALQISAPAPEPGVYQMKLELSGAARALTIPVTLIRPDEVGPDDLALASKGATVTCDGEYATEAPCAQKAIDGVIATPEDFSNRWHSSITTPHPHWLQVKLPRPARIGRVVIRFADPSGYPTSFQGLVLPVGATELVETFNVTENQERRVYRAKFAPVVTDTFRLVIRSSANPAYLNAAQISEIELYPPAE